MGRATYLNVVRCPSGGPKPTPAHLEMHDHEAGVVCWSDRVNAPGKRSLSANTADFYPFNTPSPPEAEAQQDAPTTLPPLDFREVVDNITQVELVVAPSAGCKFQRFTDRAPVINEAVGPSFVDLQDVLRCTGSGRNASARQCESDDVCVFAGGACTYLCTPEQCANTLLCRGYVERPGGANQCLFLKAGTEEGTMQPPSALRPCLVTGLHRILVSETGATTFLKTDCCTDVGV